MSNLIKLALKGTDIPSAATIELPDDGDRFDVTGTTSITAIQTNARGDGARFYLHFTDALTLTNGTGLSLRAGTNYATTPGDLLHFEVTGTDQVRQLVLANDTGQEVGTTPGTVAAGDDSRIIGALQKSTATTKGDLFVATAPATIARLPVGTDGQVLTADSAQADGLKWAAPAGGAGTITVAEEDGSPSVSSVDTIKFGGATVTDNGDGSVTVGVSGGGGGAAFTDLSDVPNSYTGQSGKVLVVNGSADGLEFVDAGNGANFPTAEPETPSTGSAWLDTITDPPVLKIYNGTGWYRVVTEAVPTVAPDDFEGLVAYYKRNYPGSGSVWPDQVNGNDLSLQSGASWAGGGLAVNGGGLTGSDSHIPTGANPRTIMLRVKVNDFGTSNCTFAHGHTGTLHRVYIYLQGSGTDGTQIAVQLWDGDFSRTTVFNAGDINTFALTYDGTDIQLWLNGSTVGGTQTVTLDTTSTGTLYLGRQDEGSQPLDGTLYSVAVWDRALDSTEIGDLAASGDW